LQTDGRFTCSPLKPMRRSVDAVTMSDERQPSYDYFTPAPPAAPPEQRQAPSYARPPVSAYPGSPPGPLRDVVPGPASYADQLPPAQSGMPRWMVALIVTISSLLGLAVLAAVAVPVFLSQRLKADYAATSVSLPATFNGADRNTGSQAAVAAKAFTVAGVIEEKDVAVYGPIGPDAVILVALKQPEAMSETAQQQQRQELERAFSAQGAALTLTGGPESGVLGGWAGCGPTSQQLEVCLATSSGSLVVVLSATGAGDPVTLLRQARAASVHHS
jgi:hypothetical protein